MGEILISQELVQVEYSDRLPSVLISQELVQVEYATRLPSVLVSQGFVQVEYTPMEHGTKGLPAVIYGLGDSIPEYAYVKSNHAFEFFDAQVDFTLSSGIESSWCGEEIAFEIDSDNRFYIRSGNYLQQQSFMCDFRENGVSHYHTVSGTNNYGKLRLSRQYSFVKVYYKDGDAEDWVELLSYGGFPKGKGNILLGFYSSNDKIPSGSLDNFKVTYESGCYSCYFYDNFSGNDGDLYNQKLWEGSTSNIRIYNNKLHMTYTNGYTYVNTRCIIDGDCNTQVDFSVGSNQRYDVWQLYLRIYFKNGDQVYARYEYTTSSPQLRYTTNAYVSGAWRTSSYVESDVMSGKLRIIKVGSSVSSYCLLDNRWYLLNIYNLAEDTDISYVKLYKNSSVSVPSFECYFDNFVINDDIVCDNAVVAIGTYTHVDDNYIKIEGGNVKVNKYLCSANNLTIETSVTFYNNDTGYGSGLFIANRSYLTGIWDNTTKNINIFGRDGSVCLNIDGSGYDYIAYGFSGGWRNVLFYAEYGKPYILGVKFIPGTGTVIYWEGPSNGYLVIDYIMNGQIFAWVGNMYGNRDYNDYVIRLHTFRCFEENIPYKELVKGWEQSVGFNDVFTGSDGRQPNYSRWDVTGSPRIYNNSLKMTNGDKIQSKTFFCAPFEIILDYNNLSFDFVDDNAVCLSIEVYDIYRDKVIGTSRFKVGYNGLIGSWVNYYCSGSYGNSSVYGTLVVNNRELKVVNDGYKIEYFLSVNGQWDTVLQQECTRQYYYKVSVEGIGSNTVFYIDSISCDSEEFLTPTDAVCLPPTSWKFSPTSKAYYDVTYIQLNKLISNCRHFSVDCVAKIDDSLFLLYFEANKDLITFDGAIVVGDTHSTLTSAIDAAQDGQIIYVLPGSYNLGGYTITKKVIIVGVGDYRTINIVINGNSVILNTCDVTFKNLTILEQMPYNTYSFKVQGTSCSYVTMDNCKYTAQHYNYVDIFKIETANLYVCMRRCYIYNVNNQNLAYSNVNGLYITVDFLSCRLNISLQNLFHTGHYYRMRSCIFANTSRYEPVVTDSIPVLTLFSPTNSTNIYLNTPKGMEKKIIGIENVFNYLSIGNCPGGVIFYGAKNDYYFSEYLMPPVDEHYKLFIQGYIDTIRVFNNYQTYEETLDNINTVENLGLNLRLSHNGSIVEYKIYEPLNIYNSSLYLGQGTQSVIDEFIWSKAKTTATSMAMYYNSYLEKLEFSNCNIYIDSTKFKFFIDFGSNVSVGSLIQSVLHNFTNTVYYSDDVSDPALLSTTCSLLEARWYSLYDNISQHTSSLTPGKFSVFPSIFGCDSSRWKYTGEKGYIDVLPNSVLNVSFGLNDIYNIKWKRNKTSIDEYFVSDFSNSLIISLKLFGGGTCNRIEIKSGYDVGTEFAGYITKCSILIDGVSRFSIDNNVNSVITFDFNSISFGTVDIVIEEVKQVSAFVFNNTMLVGNAVFINYVKVLSASSSRTFSDTLCNVYEFESPIKLDSIDTSKTGTCSLDYYYSGQYVDGCITTSVLDVNNLPDSEVVSILAKSDNLYDCGFAIDEYTVDILEESMTGSVESWKVYIGDVNIYEEFFYLQGTSTSVGFRFFKETVFEVGTYYEDFGTNNEWSITDELVLYIYSSNPVSSFYICIGNKIDGIYYRWDFSLSAGWNNLRFNFYDTYVTKYSSNVVTTRLLFNDLAIFNVWCGGTYQHGDGFVVLDNIFVDRSSVPNTLSSHKDGFYIPISFESESGSVHMYYKSYWNNDGLIFGDMLSNKTILSVFGDELCFSLVNKISGKFVLGVYSYKHNARTVKTFGRAKKFDINDAIKLRLDWSCQGNQFSSDLYINGSFIGRVIFNLIEISMLKVTGVMLGGGSVNISSIYHSLSLCGQLKNIKVYSSNTESKVINDRLLINGNSLVENSPLYVGEIQPGDFVSLPVKYDGGSRQLNMLNLHIKWVGIY